MLMKTTSGVNFINILCLLLSQYPFAKKIQSPNETKKSCAKLVRTKKLAHKMLIKMTTAVNFINIKHARFSYKFFGKAKT